MFKKKPSNGQQLQVDRKDDPVQERVYNFTVGNVEKSLVTLVDDEYNMIQLYDYLLPDVQPGNVVTMTLRRNPAEQQSRRASLERLHALIMKEDQLMKNNSLLRET